MPAEDNFKTEKNIADLWVNTLKEHGRDEESTRGIHNFFVTMLGLDTPHLCHYKTGEKVLYYHGSLFGWVYATVTWIGHEEIYQGFEWDKDKDGKTIRRYTTPKMYLPKKITIRLDNIRNELGEEYEISLTYYHEEPKPIEIDLFKTRFVKFPKLPAHSPHGLNKLTPDERPYNLYTNHRKYISADHWDTPRNSLRLCKIKEVD